MTTIMLFLLLTARTDTPLVRFLADIDATRLVTSPSPGDDTPEQSNNDMILPAITGLDPEPCTERQPHAGRNYKYSAATGRVGRMACLYEARGCLASVVLNRRQLAWIGRTDGV